MKCERCLAIDVYVLAIEWQGRRTLVCSVCFDEVRQENINANTKITYSIAVTDETGGKR